MEYADALDVTYYFLLKTQSMEHWQEAKKSIDQILMDTAERGPDDDLTSPLAGGRGGKVGIDLTGVDVDRLFDKFEVG
jgi:hypothetical protein